MKIGNRKQSTILAALTILTAVAFTGTAQAQGDFKVVIAKLYEYRTIEFIKDPTRKFQASPGSLTVTLRLTGDDVAKATRIGFMKWTSVKDDTGKSLGKGSTYSIPTTRMNVLRRQNLLTSKKLPDNQHDFSISFPRPDRAARSISELKGEFRIRIGKTVGVEFPFDKIKASIGKELEDDMLDKLGIKLNIESFSSSGSSNVRAKVTGDKKSTFLQLRFVNAKGEPVESNSYGYEFRQYTSASVSSFKKLPEGTKLQVVVETEFKDVPVTIDLKDIELP